MIWQRSASRMGRKPSNLHSVVENVGDGAPAVAARRFSILTVVIFRKSSAVKFGEVCVRAASPSRPEIVDHRRFRFFSSRGTRYSQCAFSFSTFLCSQVEWVEPNTKNWVQPESIEQTQEYFPPQK